MENECPLSEQNIEGFIEKLSQKQKDNIIKLNRLGSALRETKAYFHKFFGPDDRYSGYPSYQMEYYHQQRVFGVVWDGPCTYPEMIDKLSTRGTPIEDIFKYGGDWPSNKKLINSLIQQEVLLPIGQEDYKNLPEILRDDFQAVSQAWLELARSSANEGNNPEEQLRKAIKLARQSGKPLPEGEVKEIQVIFHQKDMVRNMEIAREKKEQGEDSYSVMGWVRSAVKSAEFLAEDTSFAKPFAEEAIKAGIKSVKDHLSQSQKNLKYFKYTIKDFLPNTLKVIEDDAEIAGTDVSQELRDLREEYELLKRKSDAPIWQRPFIR